MCPLICFEGEVGVGGGVSQRTGGAGVHHSGLRELVLQVEHRLAHLRRRSVLGFVAFVKNNLRRGGRVKGQTAATETTRETTDTCERGVFFFFSFQIR